VDSILYYFLQGTLLLYNFLFNYLLQKLKFSHMDNVNQLTNTLCFSECCRVTIRLGSCFTPVHSYNADGSSS